VPDHALRTEFPKVVAHAWHADARCWESPLECRSM